MIILKLISFVLCIVFVIGQDKNFIDNIFKEIRASSETTVRPTVSPFSTPNWPPAPIPTSSQFPTPNWPPVAISTASPFPIPNWPPTQVTTVSPTRPPIPVPSDRPVIIGVDKSKQNTAVGCGPGRVCVLYYLCKSDPSNNSYITEVGEDLLDIRFDDDKPQPCPPYHKCCNENGKSDTPVIVPKPTPQGCGYRNTDGIGNRITGAKDNETEFGEFPWMVAILRVVNILNQQSNVYQCGGSIIHPKVVLTAAHCVQDEKLNIQLNELRVRGGEWDTTSTYEILPDQERDIAEKIVHESYNRKGLLNDIALLILTEPFTFTDNVKSICLPPPNTQFDYQRCIATGWGRDRFGQEGKPYVILRKIDLPIVPRDQCQDQLRTTRLSHYFQLHSSFICAGGELGKDTCKGDGGSPLVCPIAGTTDRYYQAGIVAWGIGCGNEIPGVYVSVANLRSWIDEKLAYKRIDSASFTP